MRAPPNHQAHEAISAIENAEIIFGSARVIELAEEHIRCKAYELTDLRCTAW